MTWIWLWHFKLWTFELCTLSNLFLVWTSRLNDKLCLVRSADDLDGLRTFEMLPQVLANSFPLLGAILLYVRLPVFFILAIIGVVWIVTLKARGSIDMAKHRVLPGPPPLPLVGNLMEFSGKHPNSIIEGSMSKRTDPESDLYAWKMTPRVLTPNSGHTRP